MGNERDILNRAWRTHSAHPGAVYGNNFVECPACQFHIHSCNLPPAHSYCKKHWDTADTYDPVPITNVDDPRIN